MMVTGEDYSSKDIFLLPNNSYEPTVESTKPYNYYIRQDYQIFIESVLAKHSIHEGQKSLLELKYPNFYEELRWTVVAERFIMSLYLKCHEIKNQ